MGRIRSRWALLVRLGLLRHVADTIALAAAGLAVEHLHPRLATGLLAAAWTLVLGRGLATLRRALPGAVGPTGSAVLARVLVLLGLVALGHPTGLGRLASAVLALLLLLEGALVPLVRAAVPLAAHLPGVRVRDVPVLRPKRLFVLVTLGLGSFGAAVVAHAPGAAVLALVCLTAVPVLVVGTDTCLRLLARRRAVARLAGALEAHGPAFVLHFNAPHGSEHQVTMWLPYLDRLERPYVIVLRNPSTFAAVSRQTDRPVLLCRYAADLDPVVVSTLRTVFYVNTSPRNEHMLRFLELTHIQLNHGDSDKAASYRRVFRAYDKNFVAGQAAIDRFAQHGVRVPLESFAIVGRPQVDGVAVRPGPPPAGRAPVVLYAPTWNGYHADSRYSSLPVGQEIVRALLERGCTVVFRPHPWVWRDRRLARHAARLVEMLRDDAVRTGRAHGFGPDAETRCSLADCFNLSDALVSDVSSVIGDFLHSEKPFAVVDMTSGPGEDLLEELPVARAGYVLSARTGLDDLEQVLEDLLVADPLASGRSSLRDYYLGPTRDQEADQAFLDAARPYVGPS